MRSYKDALQVWQDPAVLKRYSGWMITKDYITPDPLDPCCRTGKHSSDWQPSCRRFSVKFRTYDDDGILYHEGFLVDDAAADNQQRVLDYAMNDAGAVTIKVLRGNKWVLEIS